MQSRVVALESHAQTQSSVLGRIIRNETRIDAIDQSLDRIEGKLDRLLERARENNQ